MDLLHRKAQSYKFSNKNDLFCTWRDFNKTFCGISPYHKWMFKLQISSIFHFDWGSDSWMAHVIGVKQRQFQDSFALFSISVGSFSAYPRLLFQFLRFGSLKQHTAYHALLSKTFLSVFRPGVWTSSLS